MKLLELTQGKTALVDDDDFERVSNIDVILGSPAQRPVVQALKALEQGLGEGEK